MSRLPLPVVLDATGLCSVGTPTLTGSIKIRISDQPLQLEVRIPKGDLTLRDLLPIFRGLTSTVVAIAETQMEEQGKAISCKAGCGACCRQPVPISIAEASSLRALVEALPEPQQSEIRARFHQALQTLEQQGVLKAFEVGQKGGQWDRRADALSYFKAQVPCPFLEAESCSIHPVRPLSCREYLVTSPASECANPSPDTIAMVPLAAKPSRSLMEMDSGWTLLVNLLDVNPTDPPARPGQQVVQEFVQKLTK